jgi:hypothetical protein
MAAVSLFDSSQFAVAAQHELRWLAQWLKIPAAAIGFFLVFVQGIFLLGQY